jgi:hypothetical protein
LWRVVWGDSSILSLIPAFSAVDIPLEDAWRLLTNRMIEHLEATAGIETLTQSMPEGVRYRTVKLYLDMATSLLLFAGSYAPAYRERQRRLTALANASGTDEGWPFPLGPFAQQVSASTDAKVNGHWRTGLGARTARPDVSGSRPPNVPTDAKVNGDWRESAALGWDFWRQGLRYARLLWGWELARLTDGGGAAPNGEWMRSWMSRQPFARRLRGWMFVWRACGWLRSWRWWVRWARLAARGSPRYWVYSTAYQLFCQLPEALEAEGHTGPPDRRETPISELLTSLPVLRHAEAGSWAQLVDEVAWNYHSFLERTRA